MVAFLKGNTGEATKLVQQAYQTAEKTGDIGGQLRYMGTIAEGLRLAGYAPLALGYVDRALKFASEHPETGFPFVAYSSKVQTLLTLKQPDEAERFAKTAMAEAKAGDRRIKEVELSMMLAEIAESAASQSRRSSIWSKLWAPRRPARCSGSSPRPRLRWRMLTERAAISTQALRYATAAVANTTAAGSRFLLPDRLRGLAEIHAAQGRVAEANRIYDQAADIVEGIMVNVPSREAQARLVGVTSRIYEGHFRLVADRLSDPAKAYDIIERARGRAAADVLRTLPADAPENAPVSAAQERAIARLQLRLMRAQAPAERRQLLDQLWEAEQRSRAQGAGPPVALLVGGQRASAKALQQSTRERRAGARIRSDRAPVLLPCDRSQPRSESPSCRPKAHIETLVDRFTQDLRTGKTSSPTASKELYDAILAPIPESETARRLFVVPDGKLHLLAFDALLNQHGRESRVVSIVPSANVFVLLRDEAGSEKASTCADGSWRRPLRSDVLVREASDCRNTIGWNARTG